MRKYFSVRELSEIFRTNTGYLYRKIRRSQGLPVQMVKGTRRYCVDSIAKFLGRDTPALSESSESYRILFINPCLRQGSSLKILPVGLGSILAFVDQAGLKFDLLDIDINDWDDSVVEEFIRHNEYDVVAYGSIVTHYKWIKWVTDKIKTLHPNTKTIIGNSVGASCYEAFMANCAADFLVVGEGEETTLELLIAIRDELDYTKIKGIVYRELLSNKAVKTVPRKAMKTMDSLPIIEWDRYFDLRRYLKKGRKIATGINDLSSVVAFPVSTARGCAFRCSFCHFVYWNDKYRHKSPARIVEEIGYYQKTHGGNFFAFWDDLTFAGLTQTEALCDSILEAGLEIQWAAAIRSDLFGNPKKSFEKRVKIAKKMKDSGCTMVGFSLESGDEEILEMMNKRVTREYFDEQIMVLNQVGLQYGTSVVFGYPIETPETIKKTFQMCLKNNVYPSIGFLLPLPATGMYEYARTHGFIKDEDEFLDAITERQDLIINMTSMSDDDVNALILEGAQMLNEELNLGMKSLIRTGDEHNRRAKRTENDVSLDYSSASFDA